MDGCSVVGALDLPGKDILDGVLGVALVLKRGNCPFGDKVLNAQYAQSTVSNTTVHCTARSNFILNLHSYQLCFKPEVKAVIIVDTVEGHYPNTSLPGGGYLGDPCDVDCSTGCDQPGTCASALWCVLSYDWTFLRSFPLLFRCTYYLIILCAALIALCCIVPHRHVLLSSMRNGPNPMPDGSVPQQCCFLDDMIKRNAFTMNIPNVVDIKIPAVFLGVNDGKHILAAAMAK